MKALSAIIADIETLFSLVRHAGGISGVQIENAGTPVVGGPFATLDLAGLTAANGGGGVAIVTAASPPPLPDLAVVFAPTPGTASTSLRSNRSAAQAVVGAGVVGATCLGSDTSGGQGVFADYGTVLGGDQCTIRAPYGTASGLGCLVQGIGGTSFGIGCQSNGRGSFSVGIQCGGIGDASVATGELCVATVQHARAHGLKAWATRPGQDAISSGQSNGTSSGDAVQESRIVVRGALAAGGGVLEMKPDPAFGFDLEDGKAYTVESVATVHDPATPEVSTISCVATCRCAAGVVTIAGSLGVLMAPQGDAALVALVTSYTITAPGGPKILFALAIGGASPALVAAARVTFTEIGSVV